MAFPDTYSIAQFADILPIEKVTFDVIRFDEFDAKGSGHDLVADLADPKWMADVLMRSLTNAEARQVAALARKRYGSMFSFMLYDPSHPYPAADPGGVILGGATPTVGTIGVDGQSIAITGLPAGYVLTVGDKGQIVYGDDDEFNYYFEFSENVTANGAGNTIAVQVYPHVPIELVTGAAIILRKPACKMTFNPGNTFAPGQSSGNRTSGVRFSAIEKV